MDNKKKQKTKLQKIGSMPVRAKAEVNLLTLPYFCLDKYANSHRQIEFREIQQRDNEIFEKIWSVRPGQDYPLPSDFERRLQRTVEYSISSLPRPIANPVPLPGFRKLALLMGVACTGKFVKKVKDGFVIMIKTEIRSRRSYYSKGTTSWIDNDFSLYKKIVFKGEKFPDGKTADKNYAYLSEVYLDNLNSMYVRPIDFEYLKSLKPIASRLYELLGVKFYGHNDFIQYKYSTLCSLLPIIRQKSLSRARQQLEASHEELKRTGFIKRIEWFAKNDGNDDWYIRYVPGERFFKEIKPLQQAYIMDCLPVSSPGNGRIIDKSSAVSIDDTCEFGDHIEIFDIGDSQDSDPLWSLFSGIVKQYPEFDLIRQDQKWFIERVQGNSDFKFLDLSYEIKNWDDWLDIEHRKKARNEKNRFPISNFKGSLLNWLKQSLTTFCKGESSGPASFNQEKPGRKGFDLPSDYRIDVM